MRHRRRKYKKQRKIIVFSIVGILCIMSAGYAAFQTNLSISAKGNIVENNAAHQLKRNVVSSGDGLYKDVTEEGRYIYKGGNPDNYITFNDEMWRIISIEKDNTLKIVRNESIGNISFDPGYSTSIAGVTTSNSVVGTRYTNISTDYCYYDNRTQSNYYGCNVWGSKSTMLNSFGINITKMPRQVGESTTYDLPENEAYLNTYLNSTWFSNLPTDIKNKVDSHLWNAGLLKFSNSQTLETDLQQESAYKWRGKVGLMNATDYVKTNTNNSLCGTVYANIYDIGNYETCKTTSWLPYGNSQWTISMYFNLNARYVCGVSPTGYVAGSTVGGILSVRPVLFIKSNVHLKGSGSEDNPYVIK